MYQYNNEEKTTIAFHVLIQWLTARDDLDFWMTTMVVCEMLNAPDERGSFRPMNIRMDDVGSRYRFFSFTYVCPGWEYFGDRDRIEKIANDWNRNVLPVLLLKLDGATHDNPYDR